MMDAVTKRTRKIPATVLFVSAAINAMAAATALVSGDAGIAALSASAAGLSAVSGMLSLRSAR